MKNIGWVFRYKEIGGYESIYGRTGYLREAWVLSDRDLARMIKPDKWTILKITVDENGKPIEIVGRG